MQSPFKVYLMGIGGVGMGALAGLFKEAGLEVCGSEAGPVYPPMSDLLEEISARVHIGYNPQNIVREDPDLIIVGNVIRKDNPEVLQVLASKKPYLSLPEALFGYFIRGRKSLVVAGTHGKTTTSALLSYALEKLGVDPIFLIGGLLRDRGRNFRYGEGEYIVLEGDEYDSAFFDKRPKFIHYAPFGAILTGIEFDHADIYPDLKTLKVAFSDFVSLLPPSGVLLYFADDKEVSLLAESFSGQKVGYGNTGDLILLKRDISRRPLGQEISFSFKGKEDKFFLPLVGRHNALNALAVFGLLKELGFSSGSIKEAFATFPGTKRRQEILLETPFLVVDDFAHHPTAVAVTIEAFRELWPARRLVACFEPRTNTSRRKIFEEDYLKALSLADLVLLKSPPQLEKVPENERIDLELLVQRLGERNIKAWAFSSSEEMFSFLREILLPQDIVLFMSNGPFDGLPKRLVEEIAKA